MRIAIPFLGGFSLGADDDESGPHQRMLLITTGPRAEWIRAPEVLGEAIRQSSNPDRAWLAYPDAATKFSAGGLLRQPVRPAGSFVPALREDSAPLNLKAPHPSLVDTDGAGEPGDIEGTARILDVATSTDGEGPNDEPEDAIATVEPASADTPDEAEKKSHAAVLRMLGLDRNYVVPVTPWSFPAANEAKRRYDLEDRAGVIEQEKLSHDTGVWLVRAVSVAVVLGAVVLAFKYFTEGSVFGVTTP